jgi:Fe-S-cluster containining protein
MVLNPNGNVEISEVIAVDKYVGRFNSLFKCQRCGKCCRLYTGTKIDASDIRTLAAGLRISEKEIMERFLTVQDNHPVLKQPCPFWTPDMGCAVYGIRPTVCKVFPMHNIRCTDGLPHIGVSRECKAGIEAMEVLEAEVAAYVPKEIVLEHNSR